MVKQNGLRDPKLNGQRIIAATRLARNEAKVERAIKAGLARKKAKVLATLRAQHLTAAAPPDPFDLNNWDDLITDEVLPVIDGVAGDMASKVMNFLKLPPEARAQILGELDLSGRTDGFMAQVKTIGPDLASRVMSELQIGIGQGEGIDKLTSRIDDVFSIGDNIAARIARTETHGIAESTTFDSAGAISAAGFDLTKSWIDTADPRTRETHVQAAIDNVNIPYDQPFIVGDAELDHPGDPNGPVEEVANCRCSCTYSMADPNGPDMPDVVNTDESDSE